MQHDELIWKMIGSGLSCKYKMKMKTTKVQTFCRNKYNLDGLCTKPACPLANSQYATVREEEGMIYLYMKTVERAAFPARLWERVKLSKNFDKAIHQIHENLLFWQPFVIHKCKERFLAITKMLTRMRKIKLSRRKKIVPINKKVDRREANREEKALKAARIDNHIEAELLERLKKGTYGDIYNFNPQAFERAMDNQELEMEQELEGEKETEKEIEEEDDGMMDRVFVENFEESDDEGDIEDFDGQQEESDSVDSDEDDEEGASKKSGKSSKKPAKKPRRKQIEIEYEMEAEPTSSRETVAS